MGRSSNPKHRVCLTLDDHSDEVLNALTVIYRNNSDGSFHVSRSWTVREAVRTVLLSILEDYPKDKHPEVYKDTEVYTALFQDILDDA